MRSLVCAASLAIALLAPASTPAADSGVNGPRIGILMLEPRSPGDLAETVIRALNAMGYREGTAGFDVRSAAWSNARLRELAGELAASKVDVIIALTNVPAFAAKQATTVVPIVVVGSHAAVETGLVESLARPGGNLTGVENLAPELDAKRLQLLREISPRLKRLGVIYNSADPGAVVHLRAVGAAARPLQIEIIALPVSRPEDVDARLDVAASLSLDGLLTFTDRLTALTWSKVGSFSLKHRLPTVCEFKFLAQAGCLISYGPSVAELTGRVAAQVDRVLKGAKPGDVPMDRVTRFELAVNQRTAMTIGAQVPPVMRTLADDVIE
jgi:putative tryptophan/tyrosine transport system substrate-binding protein